MDEERSNTEQGETLWMRRGVTLSKVRDTLWSNTEQGETLWMRRADIGVI